MCWSTLAMLFKSYAILLMHSNQVSEWSVGWSLRQQPRRVYLRYFTTSCYVWCDTYIKTSMINNARKAASLMCIIVYTIIYTFISGLLAGGGLYIFVLICSILLHWCVWLCHIYTCSCPSLIHRLSLLCVCVSLCGCCVFLCVCVSLLCMHVWCLSIHAI